MAGRRASVGLDSLPSSSSVDLYESAEEHSLPGSRGASFSGARRRPPLACGHPACNTATTLLLLSPCCWRCWRMA